MRLLTSLFLAFTLLTPALAISAETKPAPMTEKTAATPPKPKREMSEKQKRNVAVMRACGAEWRAAKAEGKVKGQKWRDYLKECRKRQA